MPMCKVCGEEVEELSSVKIDGTRKKMCGDCADEARERGEIAEESEVVVQQMMGFTGRR
jgi:ribosome-binding protein aMBF1 (putative translation factor)